MCGPARHTAFDGCRSEASSPSPLLPPALLIAQPPSIGVAVYVSHCLALVRGPCRPCLEYFITVGSLAGSLGLVFNSWNCVHRLPRTHTARQFLQCSRTPSDPYPRSALSHRAIYLHPKTADPRVRLPDGHRRGLRRRHRRRRVARLGGGGHVHADRRGAAHVPVLDPLQVLPPQGAQGRHSGREVGVQPKPIERGAVLPPTPILTLTLVLSEGGRATRTN